MEKSEPSLVPEWLKSSGSVTSAGTLRPRSSSSSLSDDHPPSRLVRNKSSSRNIDQDLGRASSSDGISPSFSSRSYSSNGSSYSSSYSNFGRNNHGRDWDRDRDRDIYEYQDKNKKVYGEHIEKDISPRGKFSCFEKDGIRRSQSMFSGRRSDVWPKKPSSGANGVLEKDAFVGSMHNAAREKNFLPLVSEERQAARVPSPVLSSAFYSSQSNASASAISNGDKWISALAEAPAMVESSGNNILLGQQTSVSSSLAQNKCNAIGLNMAEAVSLGPLQTQTNSQLSTRSQRLEELALKQCRQLVPVTPKPLTMTSLDKVKGSNHGQLQHPTSSTLISPSFRGGTMKTDMSKVGNTGKLHVLKPARERNAVTSVVKDSSINVINPPVATTGGGGLSLPKRLSGSPLSQTLQRKHVLTTLDKKWPTSQGQSRNEFFNLMRKKSGVPASIVSDTTIDVKTVELEVSSAPANDAVQNRNEVKESLVNSIFSDDDLRSENHSMNGKTRFSPDPTIPEEEEAAFLRSLGWDENSDEDGLTEEEISAFYRDMMKYMNSKPSLKILKQVELGVTLPVVGLHAGAVGEVVSSGLRSSTDLKLES